MATKFNDVMVDIETTGTNPDHNAIIQLAMVRFNLAEQKVDTSNMFDRCMLIPPKRFWDESTREWWGRQKREVLQNIYARMEEPRVVMNDFVKWVGFDPDEPIRLWAKPTHFDFSFIASYCNQFEVANPFHFRVATDMNSFIRGLARDATVITYKNPDGFQGDEHNGLHDSINQIGTLFKAVEHYS